MNDNIRTADSGTNIQIVEGMTVYDAGGDKVGTLDAYNAEGGFLDIRKGWLFPKDIYVPVRAVARTDADGIYLAVYKDDLQRVEHETTPAEADATGGTPGDASLMNRTGGVGAQPAGTTFQGGATPPTADSAQTSPQSGTDEVNVPVQSAGDSPSRAMPPRMDDQ